MKRNLPQPTTICVLPIAGVVLALLAGSWSASFASSILPNIQWSQSDHFISLFIPLHLHEVNATIVNVIVLHPYRPALISQHAIFQYFSNCLW